MPLLVTLGIEGLDIGSQSVTIVLRGCVSIDSAVSDTCIDLNWSKL